MPHKKREEYPEGILIPAGLFIGLGIGFLTNIVAGALIGLGAGFLLFALFKLARK